MGILYKVDPVAESHDFKQRGATCWYYVAKMMLKFHGIYDPENKNQVYREWKVLHQLRKIIFELKFKQDDAYNLDAILKKLEQKLEKAETAAASAASEKETTLFDSFVKDLDEKIQKNRQKSEELKKVKVLLDQLKARGLASRSKTLMAFVPSGQFVKNAFSDANLEKYLRKLGPFYVGGGLITAKSEQRVASDNATEVCAVTELKAESKHAILLVGATTLDVFYIDPNQSNQVRQIPKEILFKNVRRRGTDNRIEMVYPKCPSFQDETCIHCKERGAEFNAT